MARVVRARATPILGALLLLGAVVPCVSSCTSTARVSDVYMSLDANGSRKRNVFYTDTKEIHCVVELGVGREGVTVEAIIRQLQAYDFEADRYFETDRVAANAENSPSPSNGIQKLDITLKPANQNGEEAAGTPFPPGRFQCEAYLDGKLEQVSIFNVDFPDCPTAAIRPLTLCFGFYKDESVCPRYGITSRDPAKCRCLSATGWECGQ